MRKLFPLVAVAGTTALTIALLEIALRWAVPVTDNITYRHLPGVGLQLEPGQRGRYIRADIDAAYRVNRAGYNNLNEYETARHDGVRRIAVVGDSFTEALQVDTGDGYFHVLERELAERGMPAEVYSFGVSGNGTAQAYRMIEEVVLDYSPDFVTYLFIPNDVLDSAACAGQHHWTAQYRIDDAGELEYVPFERYAVSRHKQVLKKSALFRYVFYQNRLLEAIHSLRDGSGLGTATAEAEVPECGREAWAVVERVLLRTDALLKAREVPWILVWQGDADPSFYAETRDRLHEIAVRNGLPYLDLSAALTADLEARGHPHRIESDGHWNADGHLAVGRALADRLEAHWLDPASR